MRALVLDGATAPDVADPNRGEVKAQGLELAFADFAQQCSADPRCPARPDPTRLLERLMAGATAAPLRNRDGRHLTPGWLIEAVFAGVNAPSLETQLDQGLADSDQRRDPSKLFGLADGLWGRGPNGRWTNELDAVMANSCDDAPQPPGWRPGGVPFDLAAFERDAARLSAISPHFGTFIRSGGGPCEHWTAVPDPIPVAHAAGAPPIVVIGTRGDPNTPLVWAQTMARQLSSGVLLVNPGEGHTAYFQRRCVEQVDPYLIDLEPPANNSTC